MPDNKGDLKQPDRGDHLVADLMGERVDSHVIDEFIEQERRMIEMVALALEETSDAEMIVARGEALRLWLDRRVHALKSFELSVRRLRNE